MKTIFLTLLVLSACNAHNLKIAEDIIEGEVKVVENVMEDISGNPNPQ